MDQQDSGAQLPLPAVPDRKGARVIRLPTTKAQAPKSPAQTRRRETLWYALYFPRLQEYPQDKQQELLKQLAATVTDVSATVSYHDLALVAEVRSSLKYFGGLEALHEKLQAPLQQCLAQLELPTQYNHAAAPTVTASLLLARAGHNAAVYQRANLRSLLGQLPYEVLHLDREQNRRLYNMGVRQLRDLWRLPSSGLRKRFGSELPKLLNKALGQAPEPTHNYLPAPAFETHYELPHGVENLDRLLPVADEMLAQLADFLRRRDLATDRLQFALQHETREATQLILGLRQASRCPRHLLSLLETHFSQLGIPAPVCAIKLTVLQFDAFTGHSDQLLQGHQRHQDPGQLSLFMEQLRARLGSEALKTLHTVAEHCPEYASQSRDYETGASSAMTKALPATVTGNPRPLWLLTPPQLLSLRGERLYYHGPVSLVSGPERIETRWWSGKDIRRDYYVAREANGSRLWIFRERSGKRQWYLHGIFA